MHTFTLTSKYLIQTVLIKLECQKVTHFRSPEADVPKILMNSSLHVTEPQQWEQQGSNWQLKMSFFLWKASCDMQQIVVMQLQKQAE